MRWPWQTVQARETMELEAETLRLMPTVDPKWDRASWMHGARYALWWVIHRRGCEISPSQAAERYVPNGREGS
jgi:hypothetical protein